MKQELEEKLFSDFPLLFNPKADIKESAMGFGFECDDGWYHLIRDLCEKLYPLVQAFPIDEEYGSSCGASQVKEKYGSLRFYMHCSTDEMQKLIDEYEDLSMKTCEICGQPGTIDYTKFWLTSLCESHRKK